jgi:hypothetical protein
VDVRLTSEQRQLRDAAAKLADDLGPGSVADLDDQGRIDRLEKNVAATGWRTLRSDEASGVEVALVAEEFASPADSVTPTVDLTRCLVGVIESPDELAELSDEDRGRWYALALTATTADLVGAARGSLALATEYAKVREQYGSAIGSYQAVRHMLAEGQALIEGSISVLRHAAWAVDELPGRDAVEAARIAKIYSARAALTVCETSIQVHGGIGNTWECLAHVYLRRVLSATEAWPVRLEELTIGLS